MSIPSNSTPLKLFSFAFAKGFRDIETQDEFQWKKNRCEQLGSALRWGVGSLADTLLKEIRNPVMIVGLTSLALLAVTVAFYPGTVLTITAKVFPLALKLKPWMVKMALYILMQTTVAGVGIRAYGRLSNKLLVQNWQQGRLEAVYPGEKKRY
ncbi:MAG: hypothetical protein H0X29_01060 [Parachlamydiaceae bacterium]|nr:hypothetical protein [Parachlamydiaceae bacterium]